jgi:molybdate transport system substrate-binding protein
MLNNNRCPCIARQDPENAAETLKVPKERIVRMSRIAMTKSGDVLAWLRRVCAALIAATLPLVAQADAPRVTIFAAASLQDVMGELSQIYSDDAVISVAGSGTIARQIANGAPADAVILANADWMDWLEEKGRIDPAKRVDLLGNSLVLIGSAGSPDMGDVTADSLRERLAGGRLAIGQTLGVPAGIYGRQWLETADLWTALRPHLAETDNVRAALALVAWEESPLGIVYATDATAEPGVRRLYDVPQEAHHPIVYPAAGLTDAGDAFVTFLRSDDARTVFRRHGFITLGQVQ